MDNSIKKKIDIALFVFLCLILVVGIYIIKAAELKIIFSCGLVVLFVRQFVQNPKWRYSIMTVLSIVVLGLFIHMIV